MIGTARCKGSILVHLKSYVVTTHGERAWEQMLAESTPEDRAVHDSLVIAGGWYPVRVWNHALEHLLTRHSGVRTADDEMRRVAAYIADRDLNSVYKMVLRLGSPEFLLKRTDSLWSRYFDLGKFGSEEVGARRWKLWLDCPRGEDVPDRFTCDPGVCAWIEMGLKNTGVNGSLKHTDCRFINGSRCEYAVTW